MTKNDMARVIITALYNRTYLVDADHPEVYRRATRCTKETLEGQLKMALRVLDVTNKMHLVTDIVQ
jgi:hypothetical protein